MIVVSNTSPLNYLVLVEAIHVLPTLYGQIYIPPAVLEELTHPGSPPALRSWASSPPAWLVVQAPSHVAPNAGLHGGEAQAIALAQDLGAELILMDERLGRAAARAGSIMPVGTLGVLYDAAGSCLVDLPAVVHRLITQTNFHWDKKLVEDLLRRDADRHDQ